MTLRAGVAIAAPAASSVAVGVIREAVGEMEATWEQRLGPKRFALLRKMLLELQQPA